MNVEEIMTKNVKTVSAQDPIQKAAEIMRDIDCGSVPVVEHDQVVAMVTDRDIAVRAVAEGKGADTPIKTYMSTHVETVAPSTDAREAANQMAAQQVRRLPVVQGKTLVGILAIGDLARHSIFVSESGQALSEISEPTRGNADAVQH